jgi:cell division protease FtsH
MKKPPFQFPPKKKPEQRKGQKNGTPPPWRLPIWPFVFMLLMLWFWQETFSRLNVRNIMYSEFKQRLSRGEVAEVRVGQDDITGKIVPHAQTNALEAASKSVETSSTNSAPANPSLISVLFGRAPSATNITSGGPFLFQTIRVEDPKLVEDLQAAKVKFTGSRPSFLSQFLMAWVIPIALMIGLWVFLSRRMTGAAGGGILSIGKSKARLIAENATGVAFSDVAGCEEAKYELHEIVDFLKNPGRYKSLGARIPKGALLVGPPGTGKTLLARAVAGEAKVPFYSLSGSDFVEMFVGVGAARVRDLFQTAKANSPCIIFIDELDAIGRQRGVHVGAVNDEREQTLNQLLVEMDGFEANAGIIILAATNRPEVLDRAILRPGRFDRQILVDAPDAEGRLAILKVHVRNKPLAPDVDLQRIARATPGCSGADLANTLNEAALLAARRKSKHIEQRDLEEAIEKVVAGPERKGRRLNESEKRRVAYHEVGHALVAAYSKSADPVHKISIVPRGRAALGYTMQLPTEDTFLQTESDLRDRLRGLLGGRAAEEIVLGDTSTGAQNDLERATAMARQMVSMFGMNPRLGLANCLQRQPTFLGGQELQGQRDCSEQTAREIDEEVKKLLDDSYRDAKSLLTEHRQQVDLVTDELLKTESLDAQTFYRLIGRPLSSPTAIPPATPTAPSTAQTNTPPTPLDSSAGSAPG